MILLSGNDALIRLYLARSMGLFAATCVALEEAADESGLALNLDYN